MFARKIAAAFAFFCAMSAAYAGGDAGMVKTVEGSAVIERGDVRIVARPGVIMLVSDVVVTGEKGSIGITLGDGTLLSAGPHSRLILEKFAFDSTTHEGMLDVSLKRGTLSVISGKLSKSSPRHVTYRTPTSILGVRGTEFVLKTDH